MIKKNKMYTRKLLASGIVQIDPLDCGSQIAYAVIRRRHGVEADVDLSDCSHKIHWYFDAKDTQKVDAILAIFTEFKKEYAKAIRRGRKGKK